MSYCDSKQDEWIRSIFGDYVGYAADIGANDGTFFSNTLAAEQAGWKVLCVEANKDYEPALRESRKTVEICACGAEDREEADFWINDAIPAAGSSTVCNDENFRKIQVPVRTLDGLLKKHEFPKLDLLSIDVEHSEPDVLRGANLAHWKPSAIIIEAISPEEEEATRDFLNSLGYSYVGRDSTDIMFVMKGRGMRNDERKGHRPILVLCASRDRPDHLHDAVKSCLGTSTKVDMAVYVDSDQINEYMHYCDWKEEFGDRLMFTVDKRLGPNGSLNALHRKHGGGYQIIGVTPDDSEFMVTGWDDYVIETMNSFPARIGVISPAHNDGHYCAYPYVSREWIDIVGFYCMPEAHSFIWDTCIEMLGEATNIEYAGEHVFRMRHKVLHSENWEEHLKTDEHAFLGWCVTRRSDLVKRLRAVIKSSQRPQGCVVER